MELAVELRSTAGVSIVHTVEGHMACSDNAINMMLVYIHMACYLHISLRGMQ